MSSQFLYSQRTTFFFVISISFEPCGSLIPRGQPSPSGPTYYSRSLVNQSESTASLWTDSIITLGALSISGGDHVIRTVALGFICLAGLGAIAAAAKKSTPPPPPEVVMPVVSGNKTDRLPLTINEDKLTDAEKVDVVYVQPSQEGQASPPSRISEEPAPTRHPDITSRRWHDRHHVKAKTERRRASSTKQTKTRSVDPSPAQISELKECRSDGLDPLLRKLNLSPPCN
jgi:hypothetical protein